MSHQETEVRKDLEIDIPFIHLKGHPYQQEIDGIMVDCSLSLDRLAKNSGYIRKLPALIEGSREFLYPLFSEGYYGIDDKLKHGEDLNFDEAFSLIAFVCGALNRPLNKTLFADNPDYSLETHRLQATALLSAMSTKESYRGLTAEEIAGMVAATITLDTVARAHNEEPVLSFGGMGGDRGYPINGERTKLFSLSTLSAVALATDGPVHKHHSYPNTSKVAGQSAIEAFGARSDLESPQEMEKLLLFTDLLMTSCHNTRTLHTLSHALRGETVNHVIGPLAFTLDSKTPIQAMIGVNEKVSPGTIIDALVILDKLGFQTYTDSAAYSATDLIAFEGSLDHAKLREHIMLDEVAPPPYLTIASFLVDGENKGDYVIYPEDFYSEEDLLRIDHKELVIPNTEKDIIKANKGSLDASDESRARYLAMSIGLGLFVRKALGKPDALDPVNHRVNSEYLRECTKDALTILKSGRAKRKLEEYVAHTNLKIEAYVGKAAGQTLEIDVTDIRYETK